MHYKSKNDDNNLLIDPDFMEIAAKTEFMDPFENSTEWKESATVRELLDGLTYMEHEAVTMVWLNGLGPTEAAFHIGCSVRNVSTYLIRARTKMIAKLNNSSQMVLFGFDIPPTVRRHRSKVSSTSKLKQKTKEHSELTLF
ncbi:DNA-directed RNA polymerase specialized sigma subunit, sigma24 (fragment) [Candidatus Desulfosporosinus infrequens]|uniref:DNA-directed RNA polymerase specialized sigma subunit, sigma24 n=1 Tax=Candidatus Desulfosporosinus infrequens TaxID=2043169 RepID=A0A2U3LKY1_9FIRM